MTGSGRFFYGWIIVAASVFSVFAGTAVAPPSFSVFITPVSEEFGWSRTLTSGALSFGTLVAAFASPLVGRIVDRYGARWVIAGGAVVLGAALGSLSQMGGVVAFYLGFGLSRAIDQSVMGVGSTLAVANWFVRRRPRVLSILNLGRGIGGFVMPLVAFAAMSSFGGWRAGWMAIGLVVILTGVLPAAILLRRRPEDMGLLPDGMQPPNARDPSVSVERRPEPTFTFGDAVRTSAFWFLAVAMFVRGLSAPGIVVHTMPYLLGKGIDPAQAATVVSVYAICLALGGLLWGSAAQSLGARRCLAATFVGGAIGVALLLRLTSSGEGFVYAVVFGSSIGGVFTLEGVIWANYFGRASLGAIYGSATMILLVGIALGPLLSGLSYDLLGGYQVAFVLFGLGYILCATLIFLSRPPRRPSPAVM